MLTEPSDTETTDLAQDSRLPGNVFRRACRQLDVFSYVEQALLVSNREMVTGQWGGNPALANVVASHVRQTCHVASQAVQIQYTRLDAGDEGRLLYIKPVADYLVTLVAANDVSLSRLRQVADGLIDALSENNSRANGGEGRAQAAAGGRHDQLRQDKYAACAYAIAWRPAEPLPRVIRTLIRESAQRLARQEGCQLRFIGVASDHVHLVLQCPPRRRSSWAAFAFKRGIEQDIADRFGTSASLWQKGFLADPSSNPLGGEELLAYLNH